MTITSWSGSGRIRKRCAGRRRSTTRKRSGSRGSGASRRPESLLRRLGPRRDELANLLAQRPPRLRLGLGDRDVFPLLDGVDRVFTRVLDVLVFGLHRLAQRREERLPRRPEVARRAGGASQRVLVLF